MLGLSPNCGERIPPTPALVSQQGQITVIHIEDGDKEISEEEEVCRICLVELSEGGDTLKMECSCRGDLTLTHEECAVKWFSMKGDKTCDVCGQEVLNLPVRVQGSVQRANRRENNISVQGSVQRANEEENNIQCPNLQSKSEDLLLILFTSICYFIFLVLLLVQEMKSRPVLLLAAVISFSLGFWGLMCAEILAIKDYKCKYLALEYVLVVITFSLSHTLLHWKLLVCFVFSEVVGFGIAMAINVLYLYIHALGVQVTETQVNSNLV